MGHDKGTDKGLYFYKKILEEAKNHLKDKYLINMENN